VADQLAGLLGGRIGRDGQVHAVVLGERDLLVVAVHAGAGGQDEAVDAAPGGCLQEHGRPVDIHVRIEQRFCDGRPHARLGCQVHHRVQPPRHDPVHGPGVADVRLDQAEPGMGDTGRQVRPLDRRVVEGIEVVDPDHVQAQAQQPLSQVGADESSDTSDQHLHSTRPSSMRQTGPRTAYGCGHGLPMQ